MKTKLFNSYGDLAPITVMGKMVIIVLGTIGVIFFALPANIFGTGLALKIEENQKRTTVLAIPAIKLLQSIIRFKMCNKKYYSDVNWSQYKKLDEKPLDGKDRAVIRFLRLLMYLKARNRFKTVIGLQNDISKERNTKEVANRVTALEMTINGLNYQFAQQSKLITRLDLLMDQIKDKTDGLNTKVRYY